MLLESHKVWRNKSVNAIAEQCHVSQALAKEVKEALLAELKEDNCTSVGKVGKVRAARLKKPVGEKSTSQLRGSTQGDDDETDLCPCENGPVVDGTRCKTCIDHDCDHCAQCESWLNQKPGHDKEKHLCGHCFDHPIPLLTVDGADEPKELDKPVQGEQHRVVDPAIKGDAKQTLTAGYVTRVSQPETVIHVKTIKSPPSEPRFVRVTLLGPLDTLPVAELIEALAKRSTPNDFVTCSAEALDRIWQNIAMALTLRKDAAEQTVAGHAKACETSEETPAAAPTTAPADPFSIERRDDGWYVVLPSGTEDGPYIAGRLAREAADEYRLRKVEK